MSASPGVRIRKKSSAAQLDNLDEVLAVSANGHPFKVICLTGGASRCWPRDLRTGR